MCCSANTSTPELLSGMLAVMLAPLTHLITLNPSVALSTPGARALLLSKGSSLSCQLAKLACW